MKPRDVLPPSWIEELLAASLPEGEVRDGIIGDLREDFQAVLAIRGGPKASVWYLVQAGRVGVRYLADRSWRALNRWETPRKGPGHGAGSNWETKMDDVWRDIRFASRAFARSPGFFVVAITTLALGIGGNTAIFSVVNGVLLKPLEYRDSDRIMQLGHGGVDGSFSMNVITPGNFFDWKASATSFESMAAFSYTDMSLLGEGDPLQIQGAQSVGSVFEVLGVDAMLGRTFADAEDGPGEEYLVVLSHGLWQRVFGGADVVGRSIELDGESYSVIGVMPPDFGFPNEQTEFWITSAFSGEFMAERNEYFLRAIGRLAPGRSVEQARTEMEVIATDLRERFPVPNNNITVNVVPLQEQMVSDVRTLLWVLMGAVGLVLLIACVNLANLLMSRAASREHEMAVRTAIGADRRRLFRQVLTESLFLGLVGAGVGVGVGALLLKGIVRWLPGGLPRLGSVELDGAVLAFTLVIGVVASMLFGAFPAFHVLRSGGSRLGSTRGASMPRLRGGLVVAQVALAVVLLVGAGLLTRSFVALVQVDPGFESENRVTFQIALPESYDLPGRVAFFRELDERINSLPGALSAGFTTGIPTSGFGSRASLNIMDRPIEEGTQPPLATYRVVSPSYLATMGIRLLRGRMITRQDGMSGTPSVVVSQAMVDRFWPDEEALGKQITLGPAGGWIPPSTIVGVVSNVQMNGLAAPAPAVVYSPHELMPWWSGFGVVVHGQSDPQLLVPQIRAEIAQLDPGIPMYQLSSVADLLQSSTAVARNSMILLSLLGLVALIMAVVGVFGLLSFVVSQRTREMGIRMALGAAHSDVRRLVMRQGMTQVVSGTVLGILGAIGLSRFLESLLFGIAPNDVLTLVGVPVLLLLAAAVAIYLPARRATMVDPVSVLASD